MPRGAGKMPFNQIITQIITFSHWCKAMTHETNPGGGVTVYIDNSLEHMVPSFLEHRQEDVSTITQALQDNEYERIRISGHNMRGSGSAFGFDGISDIGRSLESAARAEDTAEIRCLIDQLISYLGQVQIVYRSG